MSKKNGKKCYAIHYVGTKENVVVKSWTECQAKTKGRNNMFKGFANEEEAWAWLRSITKGHEDAHNRQVEKSRALKKMKADKVAYQFRIDKKLSDDLQKKLSVLRISVDALIDDLIRDYLYGEE